MDELIWIEISKKAIQHNVKTLRQVVGRNVILAACLKANAYGHSLVQTAPLLAKSGIDWFCVDSIQEAELLKKLGVKKPILIIGYLLKKDLVKAVSFGARIFVYDLNKARELSQLAGKLKKKAKIHLKVDTGMGRQGVLAKDFGKFLEEILKLKNLKVEGVATHFASADEPGKPAYFRKQLKIFKQIVKLSKDKLGNGLIVHSSNSAATLLYPEAHFDLVRLGGSIYGYYPSQEIKKICQQKGISIWPSLAFKTRVAHIKVLPKNSCLSYGCTFKTKKATKVALLPIGYFEGVDRKLSNRGYVLIHGKRAKILGRVCMNITLVDVSRIKNVKIEDEVVVIGRQGKGEISVEEVADWAGTINYEITTRLRGSIPRILAP